MINCSFHCILMFCLLSSIVGLSADGVAKNSGEVIIIQGENNPQKKSETGKAPMRIEKSDGTLRPLPPDSSIPKSRLSREELQEVPDAGGGTMVNVEGRFQSILQVPEDSDQAVHGQESQKSQGSPHPAP